MAPPGDQSRALKRAVFVHGAGGGGWEFRYWIARFERRGWQCSALDLQPLEAGLAATRFAEYLRQVATWSAEPCVLIGASLGGMLALMAPSPLALVLVNCLPPGHGSSHPEIVRWAGAPLQETLDALPDGDRDTALWAAGRWRDESGRVLEEAARQGPRRPECPILAVIGGSDMDVTPERSREFAQELGADVLEYPGMSHLGPLMGRRRDEVADEVLHWLSAHISERMPQNP